MAPETTETYPRDQRHYQPGADLITALGILGTDIVRPMLAAQDLFTLGRGGTCSLRVDRKYLARIHARIERIPVSSHATIRITNVSNGKNDIVYNEVASTEFEIGAGEWFQIGETRYYALNDEMRLAWPKVMEVLGIGQIAAISDLLVAAVRDSARHILLQGEPGCDQDRLGRLIHRMSRRRHKKFHAFSEQSRLNTTSRHDIQGACNGTVLVPLHRKGKLNNRLAAMLMDSGADLRLIICARSLDKAEASFRSDLVHDAKKIVIPPLRERKSEIPELLDQWFIAGHSLLRFSALRDDLHESLLSHTWPENLQELRETANILIPLARCRSTAQATEESGVSRGTLRGWARKLNMSLKSPITITKPNNRSH